jgi:hypothetical protein
MLRKSLYLFAASAFAGLLFAGDVADDVVIVFSAPIYPRPACLRIPACVALERRRDEGPAALSGAKTGPLK